MGVLGGQRGGEAHSNSDKNERVYNHKSNNSNGQLKTLSPVKTGALSSRFSSGL